MNILKINKLKNSFKVESVTHSTGTHDFSRERDKSDIIRYENNIKSLEFKDLIELYDYLKIYNSDKLYLSDIVKYHNDYVIFASSEFIDSSDFKDCNLGNSKFIKVIGSKKVTYYYIQSEVIDKLIDINKPIYIFGRFNLDSLLGVDPLDVRSISLRLFNSGHGFSDVNISIVTDSGTHTMNCSSSDWLTQSKTEIKKLANELIRFLELDYELDGCYKIYPNSYGNYMNLLRLYNSKYPDIISDEYYYRNNSKNETKLLTQIISKDDSNRIVVKYRLNNNSSFDKSEVTLMKDKSEFIKSLKKKVKNL